DVKAFLFPALESDDQEDLITMRLGLLEQLESVQSGVVVASAASLMQSVQSPKELQQVVRRISVGDRHSLSELQEWLVRSGYERRQMIDEQGQFAVRGGVIDIATSASEFVRIDFFGDDVESINEVDPVSLGSDRKIDEVVLTTLKHEQSSSTLLDFLSSDWQVVISDIDEFYEQANSYYGRVIDASGLCHPDDLKEAMRRATSRIVACKTLKEQGFDVELDVIALQSFSQSPAEALAELSQIAEKNHVVVMCQTVGELKRMQEFTEEGQPLHGHATLSIGGGFVQRGFVLDQKIAIVPSHELFHRYELRRAVKPKRSAMREQLSEFDIGDIVVHRDFGISEYLGIRQLDGKPNQDFLTLKFADNRLLHAPATQANLVQKYIGAFKGKPKLSALGGTAWNNQKDKAKDAVVQLAEEMLRVHAQREAAPGIAFQQDTEWMHEFESSFPFEETEDQLSAIEAVKEDMQSPRPMDRLVCGDVGFGKTEVAIRAAFKATESGYQVAVLVPTTVLAIQHHRTFAKRLRAYPFKVASLTRFQTEKEKQEILEACSCGEIDVLIGTHRILSQDVAFQSLGLVVIDEEQRFGVEHKQRLLDFRTEADVLTLTATPIPRTLHMALLGIRDISALQTAPVDRRAVVTEIKPWDREMIKQGIQKELARDGQVFYVHNRVGDIDAVATEIRSMAPDANVIVGHGQMPSRELEKVMLGFVQGEADILVSTTIIESGIDIPNANTMFIADADRFGLSDLHQLRGRVGRYKHRAYCTLMLPKKRNLNPTTRKRLHAIEQFSMLGAGFKIAIRDLEIRGAGNLLGAEQSGHIAAVGYEMYCQLLNQAVNEMKEGAKTSVSDVVIDIGDRGRIPEIYIASERRRLVYYRRLAEATTVKAIDGIVKDMQSGYGELPEHAQDLVSYHQLRVHASLLGIEAMVLDGQDVVFRTLSPSSLERAMPHITGTLRQVGQPSARGLCKVYYRARDDFGSDSPIAHLLQLFNKAYASSV
ncbi:MAG: transcription-repair coupling factor, partial [Phycisphaerales bacterium]|nr:transcription-repair coupling factor [Phycisphaerales bacterium]